MKARVGPLCHPLHVPVLYGIEVDVVDVSGIVCLVSNAVLPESPLPDAAFASFAPDRAFFLAAHEVVRERAFHDVPARREIMIARRQAPDAMKVFGQDDDRIDRECRNTFRVCERNPQLGYMRREQLRVAIRDRDREEERAAEYVAPTIVWHERLACRAAKQLTYGCYTFGIRERGALVAHPEGTPMKRGARGAHATETGSICAD